MGTLCAMVPPSPESRVNGGGHGESSDRSQHLPRRRDIRPRVRVFEADPDLLYDIPAEDMSYLIRTVSVPLTTLTSGSWEPEPVDVQTLLVLDGTLMRSVHFLGRRTVELVGPGEPLCPWQRLETPSLPHDESWCALVDTRLAILDASFDTAVARWPQVQARIAVRAMGRLQWHTLKNAINRVRSLERRIHLLLWWLAERFGIQRADGVLISVPLTLGRCADLLEAHPSPTCRALGALRERSLLSSGRDGLWVLRGPSPAAEIRTTTSDRDGVGRRFGGGSSTSRMLDAGARGPPPLEPREAGAGHDRRDQGHENHKREQSLIEDPML